MPPKLTPGDFGRDITDALATQGWYVGHGLFSEQVCRDLARELEEKFFKEDCFKKAKIGAKTKKTLNRAIRSDYIYWLDPLQPTASQRSYLATIEELMHLLKKNLFIAMNAFEAHFAVYEKGGFYKKHVDGFSDRRARQISLVLFLNEEWCSADGGQLVIFNEKKPKEVDTTVLPKFGHFAVFLSQSIFHEVRLTNVTRYSVAGWMRYNDLDEDPLALLK